MKLTTTHVEMWSVEITDEVGGLARALRAIADFGADLDYVMAQRQSDKAGKGILFVSSPGNRVQLDRVTDLGLRRVNDRPMLKIEGNDAPGMGARLARAIANAGVTIKSFTGGATGHGFVCFVGFDTAQDLDKVDTAIQALNTHPAWAFWHRHTHKAA
ncbi:MAG TPA: hypothetical protein VIM71_11995 [Lacunisphaera sp.]